jgi:hypothetical protein
MKMAFRDSVAKMLKKQDVAAADWEMGGARTVEATLPAAGVRMLPDLRAWARASDSVSFRREVAGLWSSGGVFNWSVFPLRTPRIVSPRFTPAELTTLWCGASRLAEDADSGALLCVAWRTSMVFSFLFDDISPADETPGDFVVEGRTIAGCLAAGQVPPARRPRPTLPEARGLARRYRRSIWLSWCLGGTFTEPDPERVAETASDGGRWDEWIVERRALGRRPEDALFWLATFAVTKTVDALDEAMERSASVKHPAVRELRFRINRGADLLGRVRRRWSKAQCNRVAHCLRERLGRP